ncbi:Glycosyltransferase involved in cell wall bisynthesis [Paenibacillus sp. OV219]|nr:Glycosyltransferase involved in cell wall bisynthesis [Paenibacillus sp. OV219]
MVNRLNIGGTERHILSISRNLISRGVRVGIVARSGPLAYSFKRAGITRHLLKRNHFSLLSGIAKSGKYNLIHAHDSKSFYQSAVLSRKLKIPLVATVHGKYHHRASMIKAARTAKRMITVSPGLTKWLVNHNIPVNKIRMLPNGIDLNTFKPSRKKNHWRKVLRLPTKAQIILYAGRFSNDKYIAIRSLVLAAQRVSKSNRNLIVVLIGPGSRRSDLIQLAASVNRRLGRMAIVIRPPMTNIQQAYYAADIVVGTGRVALEAMACAKPVIAAGVAGYCGIVRPRNMSKMIHCHFGDHGAFSPITPDKLSRDIRIMLGNIKRGHYWGTYGAKTVKMRFSLNSIGIRLLRIYKEVIL